MLINTFYNQDGIAIADENKALAKVISSDKTDVKKYYVLSDGYNLYDPDHLEPLYNKKNWRMIKVDHNKFDNYLRYLTTKRKVHLTRAERL